jgi:hypothetical protein
VRSQEAHIQFRSAEEEHFAQTQKKHFPGQNAQAAGVDANIDLVIEAPAFPMTAITHCEKGRNADAGARLAPIPLEEIL